MKRDILGQLKQWKDSPARKPLILKGARQVGKTYLLQEFGKEYFSCAHYLNFEKSSDLSKIFTRDLSPRKILQEISFYLDKSIDINNDLLILDEIQNFPRSLTSLKYFQEELPQLAVCAAGSLLGLSLGQDSFPVGKVQFLDMYPMSFEEFLLAEGDKKSYEFLKFCSIKEAFPEIVHQHLWEQLKIYFVVGGLPEAVKTYVQYKDDLYLALKKVRQLQSDLLLTYLADMAKHSGKENAMHLERLWRNIPMQLAKEVDANVSKFKFKGVIPGIKRYSRLAGVIDWLQAAGLVIKVPIVTSAKLPLLAYTNENIFKLYIFDIGILGALTDLSAKVILDYDYGSYKGYFAENFIAQEFFCSGVKQLFAWKEKTAEVEFLREVEGEIFPIEVKAGWVTKAKSIKVFAEKYQSKYITIFSANNLQIDSFKNIHRYPLYLASKFPLKIE